MNSRLLVPVLFALAAGAWAALLWPAPARPPFALRVRLEFGTGLRGVESADAALDDIGRRPGVQDQLRGLLRGQLGVPDKLNAMLSDPDFLQGLRYMLVDDIQYKRLRFITDDAPNPLPPDWFRSWASLEVEKDQRPLRYIDLVLKGDDPERLRRIVPAVAEVVSASLERSHGLWVRGLGPSHHSTWEPAAEPTWDPPADTAAPRRRLALSLSCLALAAAVGARASRLAFGRPAAKGDVASP
jgi:hypothetical protein